MLHGECPSYGANSSYLVWRPIWTDLFELDAKRPVLELVATIEAKLAAIDPGLLPRLPLLSPLLQLEIEDNDLTRSLDAKLRKSALEPLLVDCLAGFAEENPAAAVGRLPVNKCALAICCTRWHRQPPCPVMLVPIQRPAELQAGMNSQSIIFPTFARSYLNH